MALCMIYRLCVRIHSSYHHSLYLCTSFGRQSAAFFNVYCSFKSVEIHWTGNSLPPIVLCLCLPTDSRLTEIIYGGFLWYAYILRCKLFDRINCVKLYNNMNASLAIFPISSRDGYTYRANPLFSHVFPYTWLKKTR